MLCLGACFCVNSCRILRWESRWSEGRTEPDASLRLRRACTAWSSISSASQACFAWYLVYMAPVDDRCSVCGITTEVNSGLCFEEAQGSRRRPADVRVGGKREQTSGHSYHNKRVWLAGLCIILSAAHRTPVLLLGP